MGSIILIATFLTLTSTSTEDIVQATESSYIAEDSTVRFMGQI